MDLLARTVALVRRTPARDALVATVVVGLLLTVELLGRFAATDLFDLLALVAVGSLGVYVSNRQRRRPFVTVERLRQRLHALGTGMKRWSFEIGIDLRGTPRVKRGTPPVVELLFAALSTLGILGTLLGPHLPGDARWLLIHVSYLGYLTLLAGLWLALAACGFFAAFLPVALIHDACIARHRGTARRSRRPEALLVFGYFAALALCREFLPAVLAPLLCLCVLILHLSVAAWLGPTEVSFLWRPKGSIQVRSLAWGRWVACEFGLIGLALVNVALFAAGSRIHGRPVALDPMPVTSFLGLTVAWLSPGVMLGLFVQMLHGRWRDPARPATPTLHVAGTRSRDQRRRVRELFAPRGWRVRFGGKPGPLDVAMELVDRAPPLDVAEPAWPLAVAAADLGKPSLAERLARRDDIQRRRKFFTALEPLFKAARGRRKRGGSGTWVVPHFWFVLGLMRDTPKEQEEAFDFTDDPILSGAQGVPFHHALPRPVRHHLYRVLRACQIDLVFVEDGVSFARQRRVWRALFEVYDVGGGRRRAEEVDFRGLPGTRAVIHEFQFDDPYKSNTYPEPQYDYLGRARILHVFRDRGEQDEPLTAPFDWNYRPAPVGVLD